MTSRSVSSKYNTEFILCYCGCGNTLSKYDKRGREMRYIAGHARKGKPMSEEHKRKIGDAQKGIKRQPLSEEHKKKISKSMMNTILWNFKGDDVGYIGLHMWIRNHLPKPKDNKCMLCHINPFREVACITSIYNRRLKNWAWFCTKCHKIWDNNYERNFKKWNDKRKKDSN